MEYLLLVLIFAYVVKGDNPWAEYDTSRMISGPFNDDEMGSIVSICEDDESEEAKCLAESNPEMYQSAKATLRINKSNRPHCTAWLVGDQGHVLTNWHCGASQRDINFMRFEAMSEGETCTTSCKRPLACKGHTINKANLKFIKTGGNVQNDWTLLQLPERVINDTIAKYGYLQLRRSGPVEGEQIYIPQHPRGFGKRIATKDGNNSATIISVNADDYNGCGVGQVAYKADTEGGSSGSPVIGVSDHAVVAIHHCGGCSKYANSATHMNSMLEGLEGILPPSAYV